MCTVDSVGSLEWVAMETCLRFFAKRSSVRSMPHQRLLHEATQLGAARILQHLPADIRQAMEQPVHQAIHEAVFHYAEGFETLARQLRPLQKERSRV
jgi:hypothetical protein